ncbi:hypothetical protein A3D62_03285 [Candidatus Kaiserbacteria bacterium RIFCSPHIGHO2_02_FULL_49_11]|uniref:DUF4190 domain-containing protein n=1 Tax=Candidatus Kaiserbacteria bacterium RIFCSPHIGHO2_02_FULL_49_11 TaxID=1798489 RepID=A0A1F6CZR4_9BACT|nr:MAG: hypothetical protein A3D62_03285 [Candidatus Kaiserbacteria bacterium RIFCSPHIGHO2_02_FULL_49_11]
MRRFLKNVFGTPLALLVLSAPYTLSAQIIQISGGDYNTPGRYSDSFGSSGSFFGFGPSCLPLRTFGDLICLFVYYINLVVPIIIALAVLGFFWGAFKYFSSGDENTIAEGRKFLGWGLLGLFVAVSIWGILRILVQTFLP